MNRRENASDREEEEEKKQIGCGVRRQRWRQRIGDEEANEGETRGKARQEDAMSEDGAERRGAARGEATMTMTSTKTSTRCGVTAVEERRSEWVGNGLDGSGEVLGRGGAKRGSRWARSKNSDFRRFMQEKKNRCTARSKD